MPAKKINKLIFHYVSFLSRRGKSVIEDDGMQMVNNINNFNLKNDVGDIDDSTFNLWKYELKKELPYFWESMK